MSVREFRRLLVVWGIKPQRIVFGLLGREGDTLL